MSYVDNLNNYYCYYSKFKKKKSKEYNNKTTYSSVKPNKLDYNIGFLGKKNTCDTLGITNHSNSYDKNTYTVQKPSYNIIRNIDCKCSNKNIIKVNNKIKKLQEPNLNQQQTAELNFLENMCDPNIDCDQNCTIKLNKNFQRWNHRKL